MRGGPTVVRQPSSIAPESPGQRARVRGAAAIAVVCTVAAALAFRHLGTKPLWLDESVTATEAARPFGSMLHFLKGEDADFGLYYVVVHLVLKLGTTDAWVRTPSALFAVASVGAAGWCGARWRGWSTGLVAAVLLAVNPFWLYYAQEARGYSLALFAGLLSTTALLGVLRRPGRRSLRLYGAATALLLYASLFTILFAAAQAAVAAVRGFGRRLVPAWVVAIGLATPLMVWMAAVERGQLSWIRRPDVVALPTVVARVAGGWPELVAVVAAAAWAVRRRSAPIAGDGFGAVLAAGALAPALALWAGSQWVPAFVDRYLIASLGAGTVLVAGGVTELAARRGRVLAAAALAVLVVAGVGADQRLEARPFKVQDARAAARLIASGRRPGDTVYAASGLWGAIERYLPPAPGNGPVAGTGRVWLVSDPEPPSTPPPAGLTDAALRPSPAWLFGRLQVVLWSP
jgi:mannosyltransferase